MTGKLLICDIRPSWQDDRYITFWRPNNGNYAWPLSWAGDYDAETVIRHWSYYRVIERGRLIRFPVPRTLVETIAVTPHAGIIDGDAGPVVRNTPENVAKLKRWQFKKPAETQREAA